MWGGVWLRDVLKEAGEEEHTAGMCISNAGHIHSVALQQQWNSQAKGNSFTCECQSGSSVPCIPTGDPPLSFHPALARPQACRRMTLW